MYGIDIEEAPAQPTPAKRLKYDKGDKGESRPWLRVYETAPAQLLNAYGVSKVVTMSDASVWDALVEPLSSGAMYGTELASETPERRGVGLNRACHALVEYCSLQLSENTRKANEYCLKETELLICLCLGSSGSVYQTELDA